MYVTWAQVACMLSISFSMFVQSVALNAAVFPVTGMDALPGPTNINLSVYFFSLDIERHYVFVYLINK